MLQRLNLYSLLVCCVLLLHGCGENTSAQNQNDSSATYVTASDAARFLEQATWGPSETTIPEVQKKGFDKFIDEQFSAPTSSLGTYPAVDPTPDVGCPIASTDHAVCVRDNYSVFPLQQKSFKNALSGKDQLRQRVALALSQILVVSGKEILETYAMGLYQDILTKQAFGNFRDILLAITLNPAMGNYLNMVNNVKPDPTRGTAPNENYARELLQLFSIGVYKLNQDGTLQKDNLGRSTPAYDQDTIEGFAHVFTGWIYPNRPGSTSQPFNAPYYVGSMIAVPNNHDMAEKKLLNNVMLPANQTATKDLNDAITNIFNHPNVGPFIGKQLIQQLVTSNPSAAYVKRVAATFNNNGQGIRGDMKAVVKAILLDAEARGDEKTDPEYGKLREPMKYIVGILRALSGKSDGIFLNTQSAAMGQEIYRAPSVFNFYPPSYPLQGTALVSPTAAIYTATTVHARDNFVYALLYSNNGIAPDSTVTGATGTQIDLSTFTALAENPNKLIDKLDLVLLHQNMSNAMRQIIVQTINAIPISDKINRVRTAIYLVVTSPQYQVER